MSKYQLMTEDQAALVDMLEKFLDKELAPIAAEVDEAGRFPMEVFEKIGELGLWAMDVPEEYGGAGLDTVTICHLREALGRVESGFACSFAASTFGIKPVLLAGTEEQKRYYAAKLTAGKFSANCMTEPQSGSDLGKTMTKAVRDGDDYIINGRKCFVTNGGLADIYTVAASTDPAAGSRGISLFIVDRDTPGVSVGKKENKMGIRASDTCDVVFEDVRVPASNMVGAENTGYKTMLTLLARTRPTGMAPAVGLAQHAMDLALKYVRERETFGKPIGTRQGIQFKIAEMETAITVARSQVIYNATLIDQGIYDSTLGAMTKLYVSEMVNKVCYDALQLYGGYGFSREYPLEKLYRDARIYPIFEGTNEIQRMVIGSRTIGKIIK